MSRKVLTIITLATLAASSGPSFSQYLFKRGENYGRKDLRTDATNLVQTCRSETSQEYWNWKPDEVVDGAYDVASLTPTELAERLDYAVKNDNRLIKCMVESRMLQLDKRSLAGKTAIRPLRPTVAQEAHNPAGEATDCVRVIYKGDFDAQHVSTTQKAVFRNTCPRPVEVTWCTLNGDCKPGYTNLATVPARKDRGFSYEPSVRGSKVAYAACYNGFISHQGELSKKLNHACK
ncbi:MAG: hypothetical protein ABIR87_01230 [Sphingomicrobium sp.]